MVTHAAQPTTWVAPWEHRGRMNGPMRWWFFVFHLPSLSSWEAPGFYRAVPNHGRYFRTER